MLASGEVEIEALDVDGLGHLDDSGEDINRLRDLASESAGYSTGQFDHRTRSRNSGFRHPYRTI